MPDDTSAMHARSFDSTGRTAWLLATSRSLSTDPDIANRGAFVAQLREQGVTADLSRVSRWESGAQQVPSKVILGYERVLGLGDGVLLSAHRGLVRSCDPSTPTPETIQFADLDASPDKLASHLVERAGDPAAAMTGGDWLRLAVELTRFEMVLLPRATWDELCQRLVNELARTTGGDRLRRYEAAVTLINHPVAQRHVVRALGAWLSDPLVQVVNPLMSLLQHVRADRASKLTLKLLDSDTSPISHGAVQVAAAKAARGHFQGTALALLEQRAIRELITPQGQSGTDILDLTSHLPEASYQRVLLSVRDAQLRSRVETSRATHCLLPLDVSRALARTIATEAQESTPTAYAVEHDALLRRLIGEGLFHVHSARRAVALAMLRMSPYGVGVADACLTVAAGESEFVGARAWEAVWALGVGRRRDEVARLTRDTRRPWMQRRALTALGNSGAPLDDVEAAGVEEATLTTRHRGVRSAGLLALGTGAPGSLGRMDSLPAADREIATWWLKVGPGISDGD